MNPFQKLLAGLSLRQRILILAAALAVGGAVAGFTRWKHEGDFHPLYTGLAPEDAAGILQKLRESGVEFRLAENGATVLAPSGKIAELRLTMAAAGLPKSGRIGFELFDKTNFGATEFAEHINYLRALEGELERSILYLSEVEQARVNLTFPKESVYLEARQPAKASVLVKLRQGARLAPESVLAITHLVASAVEGLVPEAVSVIDMRGNLLSRSRRSSTGDPDDGSDLRLEYRRQVEHELVAKINTTLEPLLGPGRFRAGASVECDFTSGEQSEESYDPARSVILTSQKSEDMAGVPSAAGVPGTASSLPRPAARPGSATAGLSRRTESVTYQSSRTVRRIHQPQGAVRRMSLAVLVDQNVRWDGEGAKARRTLVPPAPETLKTIRDLVSAVTGVQSERGDQLIVETLPFESTLNIEAPRMREPVPAAPPGGAQLALPLPPWLRALPHPLAMVAGAGAALLLLLGGALFWFLRRRPQAQAVAAPAISAAASAASLEKQIEDQLAAQTAEQARQDAEILNSLKLPRVASKKTDLLNKQVRENLKTDPATPVHVLRSWLAEGDRRDQ